MQLDEYQERAAKTDRNPAGAGSEGIARVLGLASEAGAVLDAYKRLYRDNLSERELAPVLKQELGDVLWFCATIASANGLRLSEIAQHNLKRAEDRYGDLDLGAAPEFDKGFGPEERFPRRLVVHLSEIAGEDGRKRSRIMLISAEPNAFPMGARPGKAEGKHFGYTVGEALGDALTDNQREEDGYRFHDALHLGFMAVLGWSPVMRELLRVKRKSDAEADEGEDSVRQAVAEEGLAAVLAQMAKRRMGFLNARAVNDEGMEVVRAVTGGTETRNCSDALWARAIVEGFTAMTRLHENGGGYLTADLDARRLIFSPTPPPAMGG